MVDRLSFASRELQHVKKMPEAYFKSLVEVVQVRNARERMKPNNPLI